MSGLRLDGDEPLSPEIRVLRDWLLEREAKVTRMPHSILRHELTHQAPPELLQLAARCCYSVDWLHDAYRRLHPKAKVGRLTRAQLAAGIAAHGEALLLSRQYRLPRLADVRTVLRAVGGRRQRDQLTLACWGVFLERKGSAGGGDINQAIVPATGAPLTETPQGWRHREEGDLFQRYLRLPRELDGSQLALTGETP